MTHLDVEIARLKKDMLDLFGMVKLQLEKSKQALIHLDKDLAREVMVNEKRVNAVEIKLDRDCENIIALFNPVAIDLRFVLACLKIINNLERTGDIADGIARYVLNIKLEPAQKLIDTTRLVEMYDISCNMLDVVMTAFAEENTNLARSVFGMDDKLDEIFHQSNQKVGEFIKENPDRINQSLYVFSASSKLERVGDQCKNIAEELIFFVEAKVLKHSVKSTSKSENQKT
ncbi:MAG TPA: phosphate signaling complex protein PhoU [Bacteroidia bacterium]|nr:phosphate signaling complex protein PhoU [Bacteroidia bacterium]MBP7715367.1 phosphate signaling complex protein PhoU [Bacteroidia bacterium]MBP8669237.1 phosphate signaling complex protein PhoU [Bacteroidia bacterium]HOZ81494.1 phosphate signaling complex protein PhoU [Bacteroidia bacterium]HOZ91298.1 phosphate signaling complex protein PhoU [Bacteroidia bacterium]